MALFLSAMLATTDSSFHYGPARRPSQGHGITCRLLFPIELLDCTGLHGRGSR